MTDKQVVQQAIKRVDQAVSQLSMNRESHLLLTKDISLIQDTCYTYFTNKEELKDGRTNIIPIRSESGDENIEGSGDGI